MSYLGTENLKFINNLQFSGLRVDLVVGLDLSLATFLFYCLYL
jgi:hypothetical protein